MVQPIYACSALLACPASFRLGTRRFRADLLPAEPMQFDTTAALFSGCRSSNLPCTGDEFLVDLSLDLLDVAVIEALVPLYVGTTGVVEYEAVRVV